MFRQFLASFTTRKTPDSSREEVASLIERFVDGTAGPFDWDDFLSRAISDPELIRVQEHCREIGRTYPPRDRRQYCSEDGVQALRDVAAELRAPIGPYRASYPTGSKVRVASLPALMQFRAEWKHHNPLDEHQLQYANRIAKVLSVGFYHGGDPLYGLEDIPGVWHECCLEKA